jgi:hypothetical protein
MTVVKMPKCGSKRSHAEAEATEGDFQECCLIVYDDVKLVLNQYGLPILSDEEKATERALNIERFQGFVNAKLAEGDWKLHGPPIFVQLSSCKGWNRTQSLVRTCKKKR